MTPTNIQSRYRIERLLGTGGFARVYLAHDERLGRPVALKELYSTSLDEAEQQVSLAQFEREARMLAQLDHPHLANIWDFFQENERAYLVMEYIAGPNLRDAVLQHAGPLPEALTIACGVQLCDVLAYLHRRDPPVIFRDLKPGNVIVEALDDGGPTTVERLTPETLSLKLIDFGIARLFKPEQSADTMIIGTPGYASPEQYGHGQTDARSDVYSLGATLHHLASGTPPNGLLLPPLLEINPAASPSLARVIARATALKPEERYQSVELLRRDLLALAIAPSRTVATPPPPLSPRPTVPLAPSTPLPQPTRQASPLMLLGIVLGILGLLAVGAFAVNAMGGTQTATSSQPTSAPQNSQPIASLLPDASGQLLYSQCTDVRSACDIYVQQVVGLAQQRIVGDNNNTAAVLSPDGRQIAITRNGEILLGPLDTPTERQISANGVRARYPAFSPDGRSLAFSEATASGTYRLVIVDLASGATRYPGADRLGWLTWGTPGLTYAAQSDGAQDIFVLDGEEARNLTNTPEIEEDFPAWSPDGRTLAFTASPRGNENLPQRQIFRINANGGDRVQVTRTEGPHTNPTWSPDGRWLAYVSRSGVQPFQLWAIRPDGSNATQITDGPQSKFYLSWAE